MHNIFFRFHKCWSVAEVFLFPPQDGDNPVLLVLCIIVYNCTAMRPCVHPLCRIVCNCGPCLHYAPLHNRGHWAHLLGLADSPCSALRWKFTRLFVVMSHLSLKFDRIFSCLYVEVRGIIIPRILLPLFCFFSANSFMVAISFCYYKIQEKVWMYKSVMYDRS